MSSKHDINRSNQTLSESSRDALIAFGCSFAVALAIAAALLIYLAFD